MLPFHVKRGPHLEAEELLGAIGPPGPAQGVAADFALRPTDRGLTTVLDSFGAPSAIPPTLMRGLRDGVRALLGYEPTAAQWKLKWASSIAIRSSLSSNQAELWSVFTFAPPGPRQSSSPPASAPTTPGPQAYWPFANGT